MTCSLCRVEHSGSNRYCNRCKAFYMREWRKSHPLTSEQREKMNARSYLHVYLKRGKIKRLPCSVCGNPNSEPHHPDYSKPLEVQWLCKNHHAQVEAMRK